MDPSDKHTKVKTFFTALLLFAFYVISAKLGLKLAFVNASATAIWAPTGIALAAFLIFGEKFWPCVFGGAFLVNFLTAGSLLTSLVIAGGNTLEALLGALLVHQFANGKKAFERASDILKFVVVAEAISTAVSPSIGVTILCVTGYASWANYSPIWTTWWLGDLMGALIVTPFLVLWYEYPRIKLRSVPALVAVFLLVGLTGQAVFGNWFFPLSENMPLEFLCVPALIWTAFRFGLRETATASLLLTTIALWNTIHGSGPFVRPFPNQSLLLLQVFMGVISVTALALAAAIAERKTVEEHLERTQKAEKKLKEKVALIELLQSITVAANESLTLPEAVQLSLTLICRYMGWPVGHVYYVDHDNRRQLKPGEQWFVRDEHKYKNLRQTTDQCILQFGKGLPGMVLATTVPQWIEDVTHYPNFPRAHMGLDIKVKAAFGFPVLIEKNVVAVLEFFTDQPVPPNQELMESMKQVGIQLGRIIERHNAEQAQSQLALLVENSSDFIVTTNQDGYLLYLNEAGRAMVGLDKDSNISVLRHEDFVFEADLPKLRNEVLNAIMTMGHWEGEFHFRNFKTNQPVTVYFSTTLLKNPQTGLPATLAAIGHNITDIKKAEIEIKNTNSFLSAVLENIPNMIFVKDVKELRFVMFNKAGEKLIGATKEQLIGKNDYDFFPKEQADFFTSIDKKVITDGKLFDIAEEMIKTQDNDDRILHTKKIPVLNEDGSPRFLLGISEDITEAKLAKKTLRESEEKFRLLVDNVQDYAIFLLDTTGHVMTWNEGAQRIHGYEASEIIGKDFSCFYTPENIKINHVDKLLNTAQEEGRVYDRGWRVRKNGTRFWADVVITSLHDEKGELTGFAKVTRDITEQRNAEFELKKQTQLLQSIIDNMGEGLLVCDSQGKTLFVNPAADQMLGGQIGDPLPGEKKQKNIVYAADGITVLTPADFPISRALQGESSDNVELYIKNNQKPDGIYINSTNRPIRDPEGKITGAVSVFRDMTENRKTEKTLRESDMRFRSVVQSSPNAIIIADHQGKILSWNQGAKNTFHYEEPEMIGQPLTQIMPVKYREAHMLGLKRLSETGEASLMGKTIELEGLRKNGQEFPLELTLSTWKVESQIYFGGIIRDITERKKMEDLSRSNTELQQFANVASHDLQEPLRMVASYVQLLAEHLKGKLDQDATEYMGFAVDGAKRMQMLVNGLLEYARVESRGKQPQDVDMNEIFKQTISNLEIRIAETKTKINHGPLPHAMGDPVQLTQLLQNLFSNALKFQKSGVPQIDFSATETATEWVFACKDNGIGIDPKYFDRIFIIFQRLHHRDEYSGTGIGLAVCKRIVERHGGRIWVESKPDLGATFFFSLPKKKD